MIHNFIFHDVIILFNIAFSHISQMLIAKFCISISSNYFFHFIYHNGVINGMFLLKSENKIYIFIYSQQLLFGKEMYNGVF